MPELPEVESVRRGLILAELEGPVAEVWRSPFKLRVGQHWQTEGLECLLGATPAADVGRRGKYLIWPFTGRAGEPLGLLVHLGMSGRCGVSEPGQARVAHTHLALRFGDGRELRLVDPRRFGGVRAARLVDLYKTPPVSDLGPEPLDPGFTGLLLQQRLGASVRPIRDALLDQTAVAGLGNIYAVEALFLANIHPLTPAEILQPSAWDRLASAVVTVLRQGIDNGGTTLKDFRNVVGEVGRNQDDLHVYGRAGLPCPRCGQPLHAFTSGGRSGVFCPRDQPPAKGRKLR